MSSRVRKAGAAPKEIMSARELSSLPNSEVTLARRAMRPSSMSKTMAAKMK